MEILFEKQDCHGTLAAGCRFGDSACDPGQPLPVAIGEHPNQALATFAGQGTILSAPRMAEAETAASVQTVGAIQSSAIIHVARLTFDNTFIVPLEPKPETGTMGTAFYALRTLLGSWAWYCGLSFGYRGGSLSPFAPVCAWTPTFCWVENTDTPQSTIVTNNLTPKLKLETAPEPPKPWHPRYPAAQFAVQFLRGRQGARGSQTTGLASAKTQMAPNTQKESESHEKH